VQLLSRMRKMSPSPGRLHLSNSPRASGGSLARDGQGRDGTLLCDGGAQQAHGGLSKRLSRGASAEVC
jgi:hypothetical protein